MEGIDSENVSDELPLERQPLAKELTIVRYSTWNINIIRNKEYSATRIGSGIAI